MNARLWKPTAAECARIKAGAAREGNLAPGLVLLEPGERCSLSGRDCPDYDGLNIALLSDDPEFNDTDLADYGRWADFRNGVRLTADGRAIVDFYIRARFDEGGELFGNVTVHFAEGVIQHVHGYPGEY